MTDNRRETSEERSAGGSKSLRASDPLERMVPAPAEQQAQPSKGDVTHQPRDRAPLGRRPLFRV